MGEKLFPNLRLEMKKHGDSILSLSFFLSCSPGLIQKKLLGKRDWGIYDIDNLCKRYNKDYYYLFH